MQGRVCVGMCFPPHPTVLLGAPAPSCACRREAEARGPVRKGVTGGSPGRAARSSGRTGGPRRGAPSAPKGGSVSRLLHLPHLPSAVQTRAARRSRRRGSSGAGLGIGGGGGWKHSPSLQGPHSVDPETTGEGRASPKCVCPSVHKDPPKPQTRLPDPVRPWVSGGPSLFIYAC